MTQLVPILPPSLDQLCPEIGDDRHARRRCPRTRAIGEDVLADNAADLLTMFHPDDFAVLHDPQTLGLAPLLRRSGVITVWRCQIGTDSSNAETDAAWTFLKPHLDDVDRFVCARADDRATLLNEILPRSR